MATRADRRPLAPWIAAGACVVLGTSLALGAAAGVVRDLETAAVAGALAGGAIVAVIALGWLEPLGPFAASLPLPALYASEQLRVPAALVVALVVVTGWGMGRALDRRPLTRHVRNARSLAMITGAVLLAAVFADARAAAARESFNFVLLLAVFLFAADVVSCSQERAHRFVRWTTLGAALAGAAAALEAVGIIPGRFPLAESGFYRAAGGFGWPNELAMFMAISLPLAIYNLRVARRSGMRGLALLAVGLVVLGLATTFSRGSWLAVACAPAVLLIAREWRLALRFWGVALVAALAIDLVSGGAVSTRLAGTTSDVLVAQRLLLTGAGLLMFQSSPIVGVGPGGFGDALEAFGPQVSGLFNFVGSAHNGFVHIAAETGAIGLVALVYFVVSTLFVLWRGVALDPSAAASEPSVAGERSADARNRALRVALLWSFATACVVTLFEWPFAHGIGQLIVLVAAVGRVTASEVPLPETASGS